MIFNETFTIYSLNVKKKHLTYQPLKKNQVHKNGIGFFMMGNFIRGDILVSEDTLTLYVIIFVPDTEIRPIWIW